MALFRVPVYGNESKAVHVEPGATKGATVGTNLYGPDGSLVKWSDILNAPSTPASSSSVTGTTDDLDEGSFNLYFTNKRAQDAVGNILQNSANVSLAYNAVTPYIKADLIDVTLTSGGALMRYGFDAKGRLSQQASATTDNLAEGSANLYFTKARVGSALQSGAGITLSTDATSGITTIAETALILQPLTDQSMVTLTDQTGTNITANSANGTIQITAGYPLSSLPNAATYQHGIIFVTDLTGGGAPCYSDGTNWRRFSDNSIAS